MVLSGTIREFILADVINLLAQQRITGRLALIDGKQESGIVFKDGIIVGADNGDENLPNKLFSLMADVKKIPPEQLSTLFNAHAGNLSALTTALVESGMVTLPELKSFAEACVEDISCNLLSWTQGNYRFSSQRSVATIACGFVTIPVENIVMEGMRRTDEWGRMQEYITEEMIFVPLKRDPQTSTEFNINAAPEEYIFSLLNGSNTVGNIKRSCCLCEYRVYESISTLLQAQRITSLHKKYTEPIQAALRRKDAEEASVLSGTFLGSLVSVGVAAAFVVFFIFFRLFLLPMIDSGAVLESAQATEAAQAEAQLNRAIAGEN